MQLHKEINVSIFLVEGQTVSTCEKFGENYDQKQHIQNRKLPEGLRVEDYANVADQNLVAVFVSGNVGNRLHELKEALAN